MSNVTPKKKTWIIITAIVLSVVITGACVWIATWNWLQYQKGIALIERKEFHAALEIFEDLGSYSNAEIWVQQAHYELAALTRQQGDVLAAAAMYEALGDYEDSSQRALACYYAYAFVMKADMQYQIAYEYFLKAKDYSDAPLQSQKLCYDAGHDLFIQGKYNEAANFFSKLDADITDFGVQHFLTIDEAAEILDQQRQQGVKEISICIGEYDIVDVTLSAKNYLSSFCENYAYFEQDKTITIRIDSYYPGDKILNAHKTGDTTQLSDAEKDAYTLALKLVEQAKRESTTQLETELWLHDWLCEHVVYESPDMDVATEQYIALRQLTCVGALLDGKANCQGYTDAFYLLGNLAGFEVRRMFGVTEEGHCWNVVKLDGKWYIVDVTFDDLEGDNNWWYIYFNVPWDPDTYEIDGGPEVQPDLATEDNDEYSYYHSEKLYYTNFKNGCFELALKMRSDYEQLFTMKFEGSYTTQKVMSGLKEQLQKIFYGKAVLYCYCVEYNGDTYVFACLEKI